MPKLEILTPYIEVFDMVASVAFYRDALGFEVLFASPEVQTLEGRFSHFVRLRRGHAEIMLNTAYDSNERPPERSEARWAGCRHIQFYIDCDDVVGLHAEVTGRGFYAAPPALTGYGRLAFSVSDPDGYRLIFQRPA
jgi:catechol 2,3-dioxygenase-like lactoylglutathione lyase family enzyme